jgi:hypothetical protein
MAISVQSLFLSIRQKVLRENFPLPYTVYPVLLLPAAPVCCAVIPRGRDVTLSGDKYPESNESYVEGTREYLPSIVLPADCVDSVRKLLDLVLGEAIVDVKVNNKPSSNRLARVEVWRQVYMVPARYLQLGVEVALQNLLAEKISDEIVTVLRVTGQISDANLKNHMF